MNVLDLFSGIGGFSIGLERAGMRTVAFCEIDPYCRRLLRKRWPDVPVWGDVRTLTAETLADAISYALRHQPRRRNGASGADPAEPRYDGPLGRIDLICGGFPCQDLSVAGKGAGIEGSRSGLWSEFARIIGEVRPRYVIVENVAALLGRGLGRVLGDLAALGFDAEWHCIPASAVGAPHRRDRVWIVADAAPASAMGLHHNGSGTDTNQTAWIQRPAGGGGGDQDVALAGSARLPLGPGALRQWAHAATSGDGWWSVEPDVGFRADGLPSNMDGDINAAAEEDRSVAVLSTLRDAAPTQADQRQARRPQRLLAPHILQSLMYGSGVCQRHAIEISLVQTGHEIPWGMLRNMWSYDETTRPSYRREQAERLAREYPDLVRELSRFAPPPCAACWQDGSWEDGLSRVATGIPSRVDRLRALGNAIVPQIAEIIGRAIMAIDKRKP